jgi:hypothetical protein
MTQNEALNILVQVALLAQSKGALKLEESVLVKEAIDLFTPKDTGGELEPSPDLKTNPKKIKTKEDAF